MNNLITTFRIWFGGKLYPRQLLVDLILIFLFAFIIRLVFVFVLLPIMMGPIDPESIDPDYYGARAIHILEGQGFMNATTGMPEIDRDPLYSFFLAGVWSLTGQSEKVMQVVNSALGGLTACSTYLLAMFSFGRRTGWISALLYSCFPLNIWYVALYRYEALSTFLLVSVGVLYLRLRESLEWWNAVLMGVVLGVGALTLQMIVLVPLVLLVASFESPHWKKLLGRVAVATLTMGIVIFPWTLRNYIVTNGIFIPVRQGGSDVFLYGNYAAFNYDKAPMQLTALREMAQAHNTTIILAKTGAGSLDEVSSIEKERVLRQEVIKFLTTQPDQFVRKILVQSVRFWYMADTIPKSLFVLFIQFPLLSMALVGIIQVILQRKSGLFYLWMILYFNLIYATIWVEARYTVPIEPYIMTLAAYGLITLRVPKGYQRGGLPLKPSSGMQ